jgi:hypothetical protein
MIVGVALRLFAERARGRTVASLVRELNDRGVDPLKVLSFD